MSTILQVIRVAGVGISLIMITYIAIKYMWSAPDDRADFKKSAAYYILGAVMIFSVSQIFTMIANFATNNMR